MKNIDWEILLNYLTAVSPEEEKKRFENWLSEKNENRKYFETVKKIWDSRIQTLPKPDTEGALKKVMARIRETEQKTLIYDISPLPKEKPLIAILFQSKMFRAAAVILIMLGTLYLMINISSKKESQRFQTKLASIENLILSDGTKITLDAGTTLIYPPDFSGADIREVTLNGEAYFEVAPDENKPFIIHANKGLIKVLGTKFNIRSWEKLKEVVVAVAEGKVSLQKDTDEKENNKVVLTEGKMSKLLENGTLTLPADIDITHYLSWLKREVYFKNTSMPEVLDQLERWYNVKIVLADSTILNNNITLFIENKPVEENLNLISAIFGLKYQKEGNIYKLLPQ